MKYTYLLPYVLLAALTACVTPEEKKAETPQPEAKVQAPAKPKTQQQIAAEKRHAEAMAKQKAALEHRKKTAELQKKIRELKGRFESRNKQLEQMLADSQYASKDHQFMIREQMVRNCRVPGWTSITQYDFTLPDRDMERSALPILNSADYTVPQKTFTLSALAGYYCDKNEFGKSEKLIRDFMAQKGVSPKESVAVLQILANICKLQDRYDDAVKVLRQIEAIDPVAGLYARADCARTFGKTAEFKQIMDGIRDPYVKIMYYAMRQSRSVFSQAPMHPGVSFNWANDWVLGPGQNMAADYVPDPKNEAKKRAEVAISCLFWFYGPQKITDARRSLKNVPEFVNSNRIPQLIAKMVQVRHYDLAVELCEICAESKLLNSPDVRKNQIIALAACKRDAEAVTLIGKCLADDTLKLKSEMRLSFELYRAILRDEDTDAVLQGSALSPKQKAEAVLDAGKMALLWQKNEAAEKLAARHENVFGEKISRTLTVRFFDTPVNSISDWRKICSELEKQYCNVKYRVSLEMLATDVGTGRGEIVFNEKAKQGNFMEITSLCDINGLHIFLRVEDENAQKVRTGFARGYSTEMYFAAGRNEPYTCIGMEATGLSFVFGTTYSNRNHRRLDRQKPDTSFRTETQFTDHDYVQHLFFSWDNVFNKLPDNGTEYRFECITFMPTGSCSWGGSHGGHAASSWGGLKFELTDRQVNAIRKEVIFRTFRSYKMTSKEIRPANLFLVWSDPEIGDPDFYQKKLVPLEKELDSYAKMVKEEMSDKDVELVCTRALPRMKGLKDEIDSLRRKYLLEQITLKGN